jgi:TetR/AcrR family transcriptional repressor of nem operon
MRVSRKEMEKNHARIVQGAARLARERGIEQTSVADAMGAAGLKHGGFYRHFGTKDDLMDAALNAAFEQMIAELAAGFDGKDPRKAAADYRAHYLSKAHVEHPGFGCPVAALGIDVARGSESLKGSFGAGVQKTLGTLAEGMPGGKAERRTRAARELAMLVGAIVIARASDPDTARTVLNACRQSVIS